MPIYKNPLDLAQSIKPNSYQVPRKALIYEGETEPDLSWLINKFNVGIDYDGDTAGTYTITGDENALKNFYKKHHLEDYKIDKWWED